MKYLSTLLLAVAASSLTAQTLSQTSAKLPWIPYGPGGGDARALVTDPSDHNHLYLGTAFGALYESHDGGRKWERLGQIDKRDDLALDNILVDPAEPKHMVLGAWVLGKTDGGIYVSHDAGKTWAANPQMAGHSIRALSMASSEPKTMIAGALDGVYRSTDNGESWNRISPMENQEIHEVESVAIDPKDPKTIYAGTWHLPWKTTDGGANWTKMTQGIIDDSDVFSIIVDPVNESNVYLSACSGIYRSTNKGASFTKVQGIPASARRTRVLMEDAKQPNVVFAGTTEGIWRTENAGQAFQRNGDAAWIVNDVNIDPTDSNRVLLATDRHGVLLSTDGGRSFAQSNDGFSTRQITAMMQDAKNPQQLYVGVLNDKTAGGVFMSSDGGQHWQQRSAGLNGADVLALAQTPQGTLLAGTAHGIFRMEGDTWKPSGMTLPLQPEPIPPKTIKRGRKVITVQVKQPKPKPAIETASRVDAFTATDKTMIATSEDGVVESIDDGHNWKHVRTAAGMPFRSVAAQGERVLAAATNQVLLSTDGGENFRTVSLPNGLTAISATAVDNTGRMWVGGREGVYYSQDDGASWQVHKDMFVPNVNALYFDGARSRLLVTSNGPDTLVFALNTQDMKVTHWDAGWILRQVRPVGDRLAGATSYEGVVLQPRVDGEDVAMTEKK
ncbi:WD40/YVTN/BNR-like repeat-containing protein [Terriglobus tenax]|uniref:WD40/YVTN/BNR-like repeat-containing protein n=1 Tax=Terriglobus tenax TaxID=1111115 RepID=UPI0021DFF3DC|nr:hypothetical protein [Terriglobus tenax]